MISGASNGGIATYTVLDALPGRFSGFITIPGSLGKRNVPTEWRTYKALIVYMEKDHGWISSVKEDYNRLKTVIKDIAILEIKGHGHILPKSYNIESVYQTYLSL